MSDLVERLRTADGATVWKAASEAADEITHLRARVAELENNLRIDGEVWARDIDRLKRAEAWAEELERKAKSNYLVLSGQISYARERAERAEAEVAALRADAKPAPMGLALTVGLGAPRWRHEVEMFADLMEQQLRANDHKGGWDECAPHWLLMRMLEKACEVLKELEPGENARPAFYAAGAMLNAAANELRPYGRHLECKAVPGRLRDEAADVANFAMMLVDRCGGLDAAIDQ